MKLRIAQVLELWHAVPVKKYGGAQRVFYPLVEGLVQKGHDVTMYATADSKTSAKLVSVYTQGLYEAGIARTNFIYPLLNICGALEREKEYDIIHIHLNHDTDYAALPLSSHIKNKVLFTLHFAAPALKNYPDRDLFLRRYTDRQYISISNAQCKGMEYLNWLETVYNGIELKDFTYNANPQNYFFWIGKFNPDKGAKEAILAAKKAGEKLLLAGAIDNLDGIDYKYYHDEIKPLIDNDQIKYVGEVGGKEKDRLLGKAKALLNPILWNEPFGLVMAEAMATGTPVISFNKGAAAEIVTDSHTGYLIDSVDEMVKKMKQINKIDRLECRKRVEEYFSSEAMVEAYEEVYKKILNLEY